MTNLNPFERFKHILTPFGTMIYSSAEINKQRKFIFCIEEKTKYIKKYTSTKIEIRIGLIKVNNILIVPMLLMINNDFDMLYETTFNYYQNSNKEEKYLDLLKTQDGINILFFDENNKEARNIYVKNHLNEYVEKIISHLEKTTYWEMTEFDAAKEKLFKIFPTVSALWEALGKKYDLYY